MGWWAFASHGLGRALHPLGLGANRTIETVALDANVTVICAFLVIVAYSKHLHIFLAPINIAFAKENHAKFAIVWDKDHSAAEKYGLRSLTMPSSFILDKSGVVRHLHKGFRDGEETQITEEVKALTGPMTALTDESLAPAVTAQQTAHLIDVAQVQGQVHAQAVHRVGELAERNPNETASIIRQWLGEESKQHA